MCASQIAFVAFVTILLFGLGVVAGVAGANYLGAFDKKPSEPVNKKVADLILVAKYDLPTGFAITEDDVLVRELTPNEEMHNFFEKNQGKLLPPSTAAAHFRVPNRKILADEALRRDQFGDDGLRAAIEELEPGMRAVTIRVPNFPAALQLGNCVDVLLTAEVQDEGRPTTRTACIARECHVLGRVKMPATDDSSPDARPVMFTLEANAYRAALIEHAKKKGDVKLVAAPITMFSMWHKDLPKDVRRVYSDMTSTEYRDEDRRIEVIIKGEYSIGDSDLGPRIFNLHPPKATEPPPLKTPDGPKFADPPFGPPPLPGDKELPKK